MREIIYNMMNEITDGYENNPLTRDTLIAIPNIAIASLYGLGGIRQEWLVIAINMEPNGVRGHNVLRALKIRFVRTYRRLPHEVQRALGRDPFFPVYGNGDNRIHRMNPGLAQYIADWAFEHPGWRDWCDLMARLGEFHGYDGFVIHEEE